MGVLFKNCSCLEKPLRKLSDSFFAKKKIPLYVIQFLLILKYRFYRPYFFSIAAIGKKSIAPFSSLASISFIIVLYSSEGDFSLFAVFSIVYSNKLFKERFCFLLLLQRYEVLFHTLINFLIFCIIYKYKD